MSFTPAKILLVSVPSYAPVNTWSSGVWAGYPNQWQATITATAQPHGSPATPTPYFYTASDIEIGDYLITGGRGRILKIISISAQSTDSLTCVLEDEFGENIYLDENQLGDGGIPVGAGLVFSVTNGWPILHPLPDYLVNAMPPYFAANIMGRFMQYRPTAFEPPTASLSVSPSFAEIGSTVNTVNLSWTFSHGSVIAQTLTNAGTLSNTDTSTTISNAGLTQDKTYTLNYSATYYGFSGVHAGTASATVRFLNKRYWGVSNSISLADAGILALSSEYADDYVQTKTFSPAGGYIYFAWPESFGEPENFLFNGLKNTAWEQTTLNFTNSSGGVVSYNVYRSTYQQNSSGITIEVA